MSEDQVLLRGRRPGRGRGPGGQLPIFTLVAWWKSRFGSRLRLLQGRQQPGCFSCHVSVSEYVGDSCHVFKAQCGRTRQSQDPQPGSEGLACLAPGSAQSLPGNGAPHCLCRVAVGPSFPLCSAP